MKRYNTRIITLVCSLAAVLVIALLPGCSRDNAQMKIPENVNELSLVQMWDEVVKVSASRNKQLIWMSLCLMSATKTARLIHYGLLAM